MIAQIFQLCLGLTTISSQESKIEQGGIDRNLLEDLGDDEHTPTGKIPPIKEWHPTPGPRATDTEGEYTEMAKKSLSLPPIDIKSQVLFQYETHELKHNLGFGVNEGWKQREWSPCI